MIWWHKDRFKNGKRFSYLFAIHFFNRVTIILTWRGKQRI